MVFHYLDNPGFVDIEKTAQQLIRMGITTDVLMTLRVEVEYAEGRTW